LGHARRRAAEPRRRRRLELAADLDEAPAGGVVGMARSLAEAEHRGGAGLGGLEDRGPLVARPRAEDLCEALLELRPTRLLHLRKLVRVEPDQLEQPRVELRLERAHGDEAAVRALVDLVEVGAG